MTSACDHCAKPIKGEDESVSCMAFCDRMIHLRCSVTKLNKNFVNIVQTCPNLFWMCDECVKLMKCARFKATVSSFGDAINAMTERQELAHAELRKEIAKQGEQIAKLSKGIALSTPTLSGSGGLVRQPPLKRRRNEGLSTSKPLVTGTRIVADDNVFTEVRTVPEPPEMFWLYLSRIHPSVKSESVEKLVKDCVHCQDPVTVVPLVKRGADTSRMSFISFKVGMDSKFRETALNSDTWPQGILFREFEGTGSKNMWLPQLTTPTISITPAMERSPFVTPTTSMDQR